MRSIVLLAALVSADPVVVIDAPAKVPVYQPALIDASKSSPGWLRWSIEPKPVWQESSGGGRVRKILGPPAKYAVRIELLAPPEDGVYQTAEGTAVVEITTGGPAPTPTPNPSPSPTPAPDVPAGKYGLAQVAFDAAAGFSPEAKAKSPVVAECCRKIASDLRDGTLALNLSTINAIRSRLQTSFGDQEAAWAPWLTSVRTSLQTLGASGVLPSTAPAIADAVDEVAAGVALVR